MLEWIPPALNDTFLGWSLLLLVLVILVILVAVLYHKLMQLCEQSLAPKTAEDTFKENEEHGHPYRKVLYNEKGQTPFDGVTWHWATYDAGGLKWCVVFSEDDLTTVHRNYKSDDEHFSEEEVVAYAESRYDGKTFDEMFDSAQ